MSCFDDYRSNVPEGLKAKHHGLLQSTQSDQLCERHVLRNSRDPPEILVHLVVHYKQMSELNNKCTFESRQSLLVSQGSQLLRAALGVVLG